MWDKKDCVFEVERKFGKYEVVVGVAVQSSTKTYLQSFDSFEVDLDRMID